MRGATGESIGGRLRRYLIAVWSVAVVFVLTMFATRYVPMDVSSVYLAAVMFSTWRGGLGAGLLATALSAVLGAFFFLPPAYSFKVYGEDLLQLGVFTLAALIISSLSAARERALALEQQARREAENANAVKDEFLAAVSHELRTPLTTIKTLTRVLLKKNPTEAERREFLEDIASECERQIDLVHNLLDLSRVRVGGVEIRAARVDVGETLRECEKIESAGASERRQELAVEITPELPPVRADRSALRRAVCAVVENAVKYTPEGGRITLRARPDDGGERVAVEVEDTGPGISPEDLPHIFERFYRGRAGASEGEDEQEVPGIGLGLHLARVLVEGMNGSIEATSRVGRGSTFTLRLPVWRDEADGREGVWATNSAGAPAVNVEGGASERQGLHDG
ncbi:MAG TPA: HAMP domain-containing sensor histidine kinase [Pyrinomonadaceae bacterium]|nr:HAMP domain-containing sensor histidine kinase [Pyrinomonadaceae bacterium]